MHNTNCPARFSKGIVVTVLDYKSHLDYLEVRNETNGRIQIVKKYYLHLPKKPYQIHDSTLRQYTFPLLYMDAVTFHRIQGASLNQTIKILAVLNQDNE